LPKPQSTQYRWRDSNPQPLRPKRSTSTNWATSAFLAVGDRLRTPITTCLQLLSPYTLHPCYLPKTPAICPADGRPCWVFFMLGRPHRVFPTSVTWLKSNLCAVSAAKRPFSGPSAWLSAHRLLQLVYAALAPLLGSEVGSRLIIDPHTRCRTFITITKLIKAKMGPQHG
jgi:hypothetical protein